VGSCAEASTGLLLILRTRERNKAAPPGSEGGRGDVSHSGAAADVEARARYGALELASASCSKSVVEHEVTHVSAQGLTRLFVVAEMLFGEDRAGRGLVGGLREALEAPYDPRGRRPGTSRWSSGRRFVWCCSAGRAIPPRPSLGVGSARYRRRRRRAELVGGPKHERLEVRELVGSGAVGASGTHVGSVTAFALPVSRAVIAVTVRDR
jgi:hypothetical protein